MDEAEQVDVVDEFNEVRLRGRMSADPVARTLPSGAQIVGFRIVVGRTDTAMTRGSRQRSDWVECTAWTGALRRKLEGWRAGDVVEVAGALRRRHYGGPAAGVGASLVDIEVMSARRVSRGSRRLA